MDRQIKETTRLRVIAALLVAGPLSWSQLLDRTSLSRNTLSAVLQDMKSTGELGYSMTEARGNIRPGVSYVLLEEARKKYAKVSSALEDLKYIEKLCIEVTERIKHVTTGSHSRKKKIFTSYYNSMANGSIAALETAILEYGESEKPLDEAVASTAIATAKRILLLQGLPHEISKGIRADLVDDRNRLIKKLEKENERLRREAKQEELKTSSKIQASRVIVNET